MQNNNADAYAKTLWDYLIMNQKPVRSDIIFCLCSHDTRVAERAAQLMLDGYGEYLVFSGGVGELTKGMFAKPEAEIFADIAVKTGVAKDKIIIENKASNTGENVRFTHDLLTKLGIKMDSMLLVQKPYMERRTYATFMKQWPEKTTKITVTSPQTDFSDYLNGGIGKDKIINIMVGDTQRIREYPKKGFQIEQDMPEKVWQAWQALVKLGYDKHLMKD